MRKIVNRDIIFTEELHVKIDYDDNSECITTISEGDKIYIEYIQNGVLSKTSGRVMSIYNTHMDPPKNCNNPCLGFEHDKNYIKLDCSTDNNANIVTIYLNNIINVINRKDLEFNIPLEFSDFVEFGDTLYPGRWEYNEAINKWAYAYKFPINFISVLTKNITVVSHFCTHNDVKSYDLTAHRIDDYIRFESDCKPDIPINIRLNTWHKTKENFIVDENIDHICFDIVKDDWKLSDDGLYYCIESFAINVSSIVESQSFQADELGDIFIKLENTIDGEKGKEFLFSSIYKPEKDIHVTIGYIPENPKYVCITTINSNNLGFTSINEAIQEMKKDKFKEGCISLISDVVEDIVIPGGMDITLCLNNFTITNKKDHTITVEESGELYITNNGGTVDSVINKKAAIYNKGAATINGGTITRSKDTGTDLKVPGDNSYYTIVNEGIMNINYPTEVSVNTESGGKYSSLIRNGFSDPKNNKLGLPVSLTINRATLYGGLNNIKNDEYGYLIIKAGIFRDAYQYAIINWNHCNIESGIFECENDYVVCNSTYLPNTSEGIMVIAGGVFVGDIRNNTNITDEESASGIISIYAGTFNKYGFLTETNRNNPDRIHIVEGSEQKINEDDQLVVYVKLM